MLDDLKEALGEKGFWIVMIVAVVLFVLALTMGGSKKSDSEILVTPTAYSSYPDAVTNANTIIDSVNKYTEYTADRLAESTGGFIEAGIDKLNSNLDSNFNMIDESINEIGKTVTDIRQDVSSIKTSSSQTATNTGNIYDYVQTRPSTIKQETVITYVPTTVTKPTTTTTTKPTTTTTKPTTNYYAKTNYTGVSIVDGLKSIGVYSNNGQRIDNWQSRVDIAKANGISNYTGTPAQNTQLLNKLKAGTLVKPS